MEVGVMWMLVPERFMPVKVRMRFGHFALMDMIMMCVVNVTMVVLQFLVDMLVLMTFGQMQPQPNRHKHASNEKLCRNRLSQKQDGECSTNEGCQ